MAGVMRLLNAKRAEASCHLDIPVNSIGQQQKLGLKLVPIQLRIESSQKVFTFYLVPLKFQS